jgi:WG repeat protein
MYILIPDFWLGLGVAKQITRCIACCLALLLIVCSGVPGLSAETIQGCSAVNARVVDGPADPNGSVFRLVLMRDDGQILASRPSCGGGRFPGGEIADEFSDEHSDGLFRFVDCGPNGQPVSTSYLTRDGQVVLTVPTPNTGTFVEGFAPIADPHGLWGYMDRTGKTVIEPQFNYVSRFSEGLAAVEVKDQWEYIDKTGAVAIRLPNSRSQIVGSVEPFQSGLALIRYDRGRKSSFVSINHSGKVMMRGVGDFNEGLAPVRARGAAGFVDTTGKMVVPAKFFPNSILPFQEGLAAVFEVKDKNARAGFIDREGRWVISPQYDDARHFCGGVAPVQVGKLWGYINPANRMIIAPRFEDAESFNHGMGEVLERGDDGKLHLELINRAGKILYRDPEETTIVEIDDSSILRKRCFLLFRCHI